MWLSGLQRWCTGPSIHSFVPGSTTLAAIKRIALKFGRHSWSLGDESPRFTFVGLSEIPKQPFVRLPWQLGQTFMLPKGLVLATLPSSPGQISICPEILCLWQNTFKEEPFPLVSTLLLCSTNEMLAFWHVNTETSLWDQHVLSWGSHWGLIDVMVVFHGECLSEPQNGTREGIFCHNFTCLQGTKISYLVLEYLSLYIDGIYVILSIFRNIAKETENKRENTMQVTGFLIKIALSVTIKEQSLPHFCPVLLSCPDNRLPLYTGMHMPRVSEWS